MEMTPLVGSIASGYGSQAPQGPEATYGENTEDLKKASSDFVSILFSYMFQTMRGNPDDQSEDEEKESLFGGENVGMFMGFLDQEVGKKFADQGGKDMVDALYYQLKGNNVLPGGKGGEKMISKGNPGEENAAASNVIEKNKLI
jgi:Rod binding domain-containing protein